jgi:hypothetical protein
LYTEDDDDDNQFVLSSEDELAVTNPSKIPRKAGSNDTNVVVLTDGAVMLSDAELGLLYPPQLPPESMSLVTFPIEANQPTKIPGNIVHNIPNASYLKRFFLQDSPDARRKKCLEGAEKRKSVNPVIVPPTLWSSIELSMVLVPAEPATPKDT